MDRDEALHFHRPLVAVEPQIIGGLPARILDVGSDRQRARALHLGAQHVTILRRVQQRIERRLRLLHRLFRGVERGFRAAGFRLGGNRAFGGGQNLVLHHLRQRAELFRRGYLRVGVLEIGDLVARGLRLRADHGHGVFLFRKRLLRRGQPIARRFHCGAVLPADRRRAPGEQAHRTDLHTVARNPQRRDVGALGKARHQQVMAALGGVQRDLPHHLRALRKERHGCDLARCLDRVGQGGQGGRGQQGRREGNAHRFLPNPFQIEPASRRAQLQAIEIRRGSPLAGTRQSVRARGRDAVPACPCVRSRARLRCALPRGAGQSG